MSLLHRVRMFCRKPHNLILAFLFVALIVLTFLPLLSIVLDTFTVHTSEVMRIRGSHAGDWTLYHWRKVLLDGENSMAIFRSSHSGNRHRNGTASRKSSQKCGTCTADKISANNEL